MKKCFFGVVFLLLVCVFFSGCQVRDCPDVDEGSIIPIGCIKQYPDVYLNKTITVKGKFFQNDSRTWITDASIFYGHVSEVLFITFSDEIDASFLINKNEYLFKGIVRYGELPQFIKGNEDFYFIVNEIR